MRLTAPVRTQGRVVIPAHVRDKLEIEPDDLVELEVEPVDG
jgi:AbrB family looped-hinge helix DNA binding protein